MVAVQPVRSAEGSQGRTGAGARGGAEQQADDQERRRGQQAERAEDGQVGDGARDEPEPQALAPSADHRARERRVHPRGKEHLVRVHRHQQKRRDDDGEGARPDGPLGVGDGATEDEQRRQGQHGENGPGERGERGEPLEPFVLCGKGQERVREPLVQDVEEERARRLGLGERAELTRRDVGLVAAQDVGDGHAARRRACKLRVPRVQQSVTDREEAAVLDEGEADEEGPARRRPGASCAARGGGRERPRRTP